MSKEAYDEWMANAIQFELAHYEGDEELDINLIKEQIIVDCLVDNILNDGMLWEYCSRLVAERSEEWREVLEHSWMSDDFDPPDKWCEAVAVEIQSRVYEAAKRIYRPKYPKLVEESE